MHAVWSDNLPCRAALETASDAERIGTLQIGFPWWFASSGLEEMGKTLVESPGPFEGFGGSSVEGFL